MRHRDVLMRVLRLAMGLALSGTLALMLGVANLEAETGDYYCVPLDAEYRPEMGNHVVWAHGILGFMDWADNPTNVEVDWDVDGDSCQQGNPAVFDVWVE